MKSFALPNGLTATEFQAGPSRFVAIPELGARLLSWHLTLAGGREREIIFWPQDADYSNCSKVRGGNPILFPFSGRSYDKGDIYFWRDADGVRRPMPMHGFGRDCIFKMESISDSGFTGLMIPNDEAKEAYPFAYEFRVTYRFEALSLKVILELKNLDTKPILWSAGHHFYFTLPWLPNTTRKDYRIQLPAKKAFTRADDGSLRAVEGYELPKGDAGFSFADNSIVDRIHTHLKDNVVRFGPNNGEESIVITINDGPNSVGGCAVVTWTADDTAPFFCVEPWMGPPNAAEHKQGLHSVNPGQTEQFTVAIELA